MLENLTSITDEEFYKKNIKEIKKEENYLYHYIIIKLKNNKYIKIDTIDQLQNIKENEIKYKYYCEKIHYYNESNNLLFDEGYPIYIYNLGYFMIDGLADPSEKDKIRINRMIENYNKKYNKNIQDDKRFLKLNKSINTF